jgi:transposase
MSKQHRVEVARTRCASTSPRNKSPVARVLGIVRSSLSAQTKRPKWDNTVAVRIEEAGEKDETMGRRKPQRLRSPHSTAEDATGCATRGSAGRNISTLPA